MTQVDIPLDLKKFDKNSKELEIFNEALAARATAFEMTVEERYIDAIERTVSALKTMREFPDFDDREFRSLLVALLFDLAEIHFAPQGLQAERKGAGDALQRCAGNAPERGFRPVRTVPHPRNGTLHPDIPLAEEGPRHAVKQQINTGQLYEKVNSGVVAATDKLVDSLRKTGQLLSSV